MKSIMKNWLGTTYSKENQKGKKLNAVRESKTREFAVHHKEIQT